jgi:hypothetical protein
MEPILEHIFNIGKYGKDYELVRSCDFQNKCVVIEYKSTFYSSMSLDLKHHSGFIMPFVSSFKQSFLTMINECTKVSTNGLEAGSFFNGCEIERFLT